jgi:anti-sigma factor RsiW
MNCQDFELDIDDYVDGRLAPEPRARLETHLRGCAACRALAVDLRTLFDAIDTLEPQRPSPHVWTRIAAAVETEADSSRLLGRLGLRATSWHMAMSAAAIVCLLIGGTWLAFRDAASASRPVHHAQAVSESSPLQPVGAVVDAAQSDYASAITSLERIANTDADALDAPTATVVRNNLAVLDTAIRESQRALDTNPSSDVARESLFDALRTKVTLLQDTVALINDVRNDKAVGDTRTNSGTNQ